MKAISNNSLPTLKNIMGLALLIAGASINSHAQHATPNYGTPKIRALIPNRTNDVQFVYEVVNPPLTYQQPIFGWTSLNFSTMQGIDFLPAFDGRMDAMVQNNGQIWVAGHYGNSDGRIWTGVIDTTGTRTNVKDWGHLEISSNTNSMDYVKAIFNPDPDTLELAGGFYSPALGNRIFYAAFDTMGQVARVNHTPLDGDAYLRAAIAEDQGGAYLAGMTRIAGGGNAENEIFVARFNQWGQIGWRKNFSLPNFSGHNILDVAQNPTDGKIYFIGQADSTLQTHLLFGSIHPDGTHPYLMDGGLKESGEYRLAVSPTGRIVIGVPGNIGASAKIWEVDTLGNRIQYFLPMSDRMKEIHQLRWADSQSLWVAGRTKNTPQDTLFLDRLAMPTVGLPQQMETIPIRLRPYPIPAHDQIWIDLQPLGATPHAGYTLSYCSPDGRSHPISPELEGPHLKIHRHNLPAGIYYLSIETGNQKAIVKLVWD